MNANIRAIFVSEYESFAMFYEEYSFGFMRSIKDKTLDAVMVPSR